MTSQTPNPLTAFDNRRPCLNSCSASRDCGNTAKLKQARVRTYRVHHTAQRRIDSLVETDTRGLPVQNGGTVNVEDPGALSARRHIIRAAIQNNPQHMYPGWRDPCSLVRARHIMPWRTSITSRHSLVICITVTRVRVYPSQDLCVAVCALLKEYWMDRLVACSGSPQQLRRHDHHRPPTD